MLQKLRVVDFFACLEKLFVGISFWKFSDNSAANKM
jgi:hypothetical protein